MVKFFDELGFDGGHVDGVVCEACKGAYLFVDKAAGVDITEIFQVGIDVKSKAVVGDEMEHFDADSADFGVAYPHSRCPVAPAGFDAVSAYQPYDALFYLVDIFLNAYIPVV